MPENRHSSASDQPRNEWDPCPAGTISGLAGRLKHRTRVQRVRQLAAVAGGLLVLVILGRSLMMSPGKASAHPALSHHEVAQLAEKFIRGELDEEQTQLVEEHIAVCPECKHLLEDREEYQAKMNSQSRLEPETDAELIARSH